MTARTDALDPRHALDRSARGAATVPAALRELPTRSALVVLVAAWILFGLVGHDPWKPDEAHNFGVVLELLRSHDWVVPTLAGEPWLEKPPLFYVVAATFAAAL